MVAYVQSNETGTIRVCLCDSDLCGEQSDCLWYSEAFLLIHIILTI